MQEVFGKARADGPTRVPIEDRGTKDGEGALDCIGEFAFQRDRYGVQLGAIRDWVLGVELGLHQAAPRRSEATVPVKSWVAPALNVRRPTDLNPESRKSIFNRSGGGRYSTESGRYR